MSEKQSDKTVYSKIVDEFAKYPQDWTRIQLLCSTYMKGRIGWQGLKASEFIQTGPFLITGTDFIKGNINWETCYHISEKRFNEAPLIHIKDGDVLITKDGTIGKTAFVRNCPEYAILNSGVLVMRCIDGSYDHQYLFYILNSVYFERFIAAALGGSTINHLYQRVFEKFEFPSPTSLAEQRKIARILSTVDAAIKKTEAAIVKYKSIKEGMMCDLFTRGIELSTGKLRPSCEAAPEIYKQSELGWIPKEWDVVKIGDFAHIKGGKRLPAGREFSDMETAFPYLRVTDMENGTIIQTDLKYVPVDIEPLIRSYKISAKDVYVTIAGTLGLFGTIPDNLNNAQLTENAAKITDFDVNQFKRDYIKHQCNSEVIQSQINREIGVGGGVPKLALFRIARFSFIKPMIKEQSMIVSRINKAEQIIQKEIAYLEKHIYIKQALMSDLLTGKVRVKYKEEKAEVA
jgi:type I restriction enzyme S subunit